MDYNAYCTDDTGTKRKISITAEDSIEALKNDYLEIVHRYDPMRVDIQRVRAGVGEAMHLRVTVYAPSHYLTSLKDMTPKTCRTMAVDIICYPGYPVTPVKALYSKDHFLASPNVFRTGNACIDTWIPFTSSLITVVDKLVRDIIHDPEVTRYDSMANSSMERWHKQGVETKQFPTIQPKLLYAPEVIALPPRNTDRKPEAAPPPIPGRRQ